MENKLALPIGVSDFRGLRESSYYYVDKSQFIAELLHDQANVTLITRPRRFGKTLAMTMVRDFFDQSQDSKAIFSGLAIMETAYAHEINNYPVIYLTFKDCKGNVTSALTCVYRMIFDTFETVQPICDQMSMLLLKKYDQILDILMEYDFSKKNYLEDAILFLSKIYYQHYGKKVIILIDEYDTPMISAYEQGYYDDIKDFFTSLYGTALKDNPYLHFALLTGIHRVAKENIFSGLNNLKVCTVMDAQYSRDFGLTEEETKELLAYYDLPLTDSVENMYNGYHFAGCQIYNPWSIINYASVKELHPFWINTSTNLLVRQLIMVAGSDFREGFETLISVGTANVRLKLATSFFELQQTETLWGLLLNTGYITVLNNPIGTFDLYSIKIPNKEVRGEFQEIVAAYTGFGESRLVTLFGALVRKDVAEFTKIYQAIILENTSFYDGKENAYHMLALGMCVYLEGYYEVKSNIEAGHGRSDIMLVAKDSQYNHVIMEFKQGQDTQQLANNALRQIHDNQYYAGLRGDILLLGIAHDKKHCHIASDKTILLLINGYRQQPAENESNLMPCERYV